MSYIGGIINNVSKNIPVAVFIYDKEKNEFGYKTEDNDLFIILDIISTKKILPIFVYENFENGIVGYEMNINIKNKQYITAINYYLPMPYRIVYVELTDLEDNAAELLEQIFIENIQDGGLENEIEENI